MILFKILSIMTFFLFSYADDTGMIAYFDGSCPDGWEEYDNLAGRFPLGEGTYVGLAEDGRTEAIAWQNGQTGGEVKHTQTVDEMPKHKHKTGLAGYLDGLTNDDVSSRSVYGYSYNPFNRLYTTEEGGDQPHNNMPPYLVLTPCIKTESSSCDCQATDLTTLESDVDNVESSITTIESDITNVESSITTIESDVEDVEDDIVDLKAEIALLKLKMEDLEDTKSDPDASSSSSTNNMQLSIWGTMSGLLARFLFG